MPTPQEQCLTALQQVLAFYRAQNACPCAFPRFGQLVQFHFRNFTDSPVGCHITEYAIHLVCDKDGFYKAARTAGDVEQLTCTVCNSELDSHWEQFSINMDLTSLTYRIVRAQPQGPSPYPQIPLPRGFYGFDDTSIAQCADRFSHEATFEEMSAYLTELRQP